MQSAKCKRQNCGRGSDITIIKINSRKDRFVVNKSGQINNSPVGDVREADRGHYNASQTLNSAFCILHSGKPFRLTCISSSASASVQGFCRREEQSFHLKIRVPALRELSLKVRRTQPYRLPSYRRQG